MNMKQIVICDQEWRAVFNPSDTLELDQILAMDPQLMYVWTEMIVHGHKFAITGYKRDQTDRFYVTEKPWDDPIIVHWGALSDTQTGDSVDG